MDSSNGETNQTVINQWSNHLKNELTFDNLIIVGFVGLGFVGIVNHEMWRDELQAWLIARDSSSIPELIRNLKTEGHPGLWHLCLYFLKHLTRDPVIMQLFHLLIATGAVVLFVKFSPFKKFHKLTHLTTVGTRNKMAVTLSGYLDKQIYYPEADRFGSFWSAIKKGRVMTKEQRVNDKELSEAVEKLLPQSETDILLVLSQKLDDPLVTDTEALASFEGGIVDEENFYLYLVRKN